MGTRRSRIYLCRVRSGGKNRYTVLSCQFSVQETSSQFVVQEKQVHSSLFAVHSSHSLLEKTSQLAVQEQQYFRSTSVRALPIPSARRSGRQGWNAELSWSEQPFSYSPFWAPCSGCRTR